MPYREQIFKAEGGPRLFVRRWEIDNPRSVVVVVHGYADHSGRYAALAEYLNQDGHGVVACDQRGFGRSDGHSGRIVSLPDLERDLFNIIASCTAEYRVPVDLFGHSFGGALSAIVATNEKAPVRSLVLSSPAFRVRSLPLLQPFAGLLARIAPRLPVSRIDEAVLSTDTMVVRAAREDKLRYSGKTDAWTGAQIIRAGRRAFDCAARLHKPLLVFHGTGDKLTDHRESERFVREAASRRKAFHALEGFYHETFNEPGKASVFSLVTRFLAGLSTGLNPPNGGHSPEGADSVGVVLP